MWAKVQSWWRHSSTFGGAPTPFEVACRCGAVLRGWRGPAAQVLTCPQCRGAVFVLPRSPRPLVLDPAVPRPLARPRRRWLLPAATAGFILAGLVLITLTLWHGNEPVASDKLATDRPTFERRLAAAHQHLDVGAFRQAADELRPLLALSRAQPELISAGQLRELEQLARQADALADLCGETLEEILAHAGAVADDEWRAEFPHRYRGRAFLFDLEIRAAGGGHFAHPYLLWVGKEPAHLDLDRLELLTALPLDPPQRMIFAARLAAVHRVPGRGWVVELEPASGVLLTEAGPARLCCPDLAGPETLAVLQRQRLWNQGPAGAK
jgi:hypothetical protein